MMEILIDILFELFCRKWDKLYLWQVELCVFLLRLWNFGRIRTSKQEGIDSRSKVLGAWHLQYQFCTFGCKFLICYEQRELRTFACNQVSRYSDTVGAGRDHWNVLRLDSIRELRVCIYCEQNYVNYIRVYFICFK